MVMNVDLHCILLFLRDGEYPQNAPKNLKRSIRRRVSTFVFQNGEIYLKSNGAYDLGDAPRSITKIIESDH